jgi:hypothetical protein
MASSSLPAGKALKKIVRRAKVAKAGLNLQQLSNVGTDGDTRVSDAEELVDETSSGDEDDTDEPSTESACGNGGIIVVVDDSTHFGVWRVLPQSHNGSAKNPTWNTHNDDQGSFDLELLVNPLVLRPGRSSEFHRTCNGLRLRGREEGS